MPQLLHSPAEKTLPTSGGASPMHAPTLASRSPDSARHSASASTMPPGARQTPSSAPHLGSDSHRDLRTPHSPFPFRLPVPHSTNPPDPARQARGRKM